MESPDVILLFTGALIGAQSMNALHAWWGWRDSVRDSARARAAARRSAGDRYLSSLRLYQLQHRERV